MKSCQFQLNLFGKLKKEKLFIKASCMATFYFRSPQLSDKAFRHSPLIMKLFLSFPITLTRTNKRMPWRLNSRRKNINSREIETSQSESEWKMLKKIAENK